MRLTLADYQLIPKEELYGPLFRIGSAEEHYDDLLKHAMQAKTRVVQPSKGEAFMKSTQKKLDYMAKYQKEPENVEKRVDRNRARRHAIAAGTAKVGDGKDVDHKKPLGAGGSDADSNTRAISRSKNRGWRKGQSGYNPKSV